MDSLPGGIGFPQLVHVTRDSFSDITVTLLCEVFGGVPYNCYAQILGLDAGLGVFVMGLCVCWGLIVEFGLFGWFLFLDS